MPSLSHRRKYLNRKIKEVKASKEVESSKCAECKQIFEEQKHKSTTSLEVIRLAFYGVSVIALIMGGFISYQKFLNNTEIIDMDKKMQTVIATNQKFYARIVLAEFQAKFLGLYNKADLDEVINDLINTDDHNSAVDSYISKTSKDFLKDFSSVQEPLKLENTVYFVENEINKYSDELDALVLETFKNNVLLLSLDKNDNKYSEAFNNNKAFLDDVNLLKQKTLAYKENYGQIIDLTAFVTKKNWDSVKAPMWPQTVLQANPVPSIKGNSWVGFDLKLSPEMLDQLKVASTVFKSYIKDKVKTESEIRELINSVGMNHWSELLTKTLVPE